MWWTPNATTLYQANGTYSNHRRLNAPQRLFAKNNFASNPWYRLRVKNLELELKHLELERDPDQRLGPPRETGVLSSRTISKYLDPHTICLTIWYRLQPLTEPGGVFWGGGGRDAGPGAL